MYTANKDVVKTFAQQIESLAQELSKCVDNGGDMLPIANELVRNASTLTFALGEVHAAEQLGNQLKKQLSGTINVKISNKPSNYHNLRDSLGRFKKV